jgi:hypothetical protein
MRSVEDDEEVQKRGIVGCIYCVGGGMDFDLQSIRKTAKLRKVLPVRSASVHVCSDDPRLVPVFSLAVLSMRTRTRIRFRAHYGSDEECRCQLGTFGIPISALPPVSPPRGEFNLENHRLFMARERAIEATKSKRPLGVAPKATKKPEETARSRRPIIKEDDVFVAAAPQPDLNEPTGYGRFMSFSNLGFLLPQPSFANPTWSVVGAPTAPLGVVPAHHLRQLPVVPLSHMIGSTNDSRPPAKFCEAQPCVIYDPLPNDVLLGRGKPIIQRPGSVRFREMIDTHKDKYDQGGKGAKVAAMAFIVHLVKEDGGRFLKESENGRSWVEVDEATALAKVGNAFRTQRRVRQATLKKDKSTA